MNVLMCLSGGLDSASLLAMILNTSWRGKVACVNFQYGSKHNKYELKAAERIANHYKLGLNVIDLSLLFSQFNSALLSNDPRDIPEGHYAGENMRQTVVPGRNMIFAAILAGLAESKGYTRVALGVHAGDHHIYPDCRPEFMDSMNEAIRAASDGKVMLYTPFINIDKAKIVKVGVENQVPFHLTRTCYKDQQNPCGKCGSCVERAEAFSINGMVDPAVFSR